MSKQKLSDILGFIWMILARSEFLLGVISIFV